ncbi:MAG: restriction endonuclease subunit S [Burkholderiaceae bacterium]
MSAKRQATNLGAICKFSAGSAFKPEYQGCSAGDYPFIKVSDMNAAGNEFFITGASNYVNELQRAAMNARLHPVGATVFAKIGVALTTNRRRLLTRPTIIDNNMMSATPRDGKVTSRFLYFLLISLDFNTVSAGTALPYLNVSDLERIEVSIPETLAEQEAISRILGDIDDKIDLNRRINQTLEAMAQAIFKSWFVDFDPVKARIAAKAEGRDPLRAAMTAISGKPDAELDTLPPDQFATLAATAALFPDEMEESELGEIPKGWQVKTLMQIARFPVGKIDVANVDTSTYVSTENMLENRGGICEASSLPSVATVPSFSSGQVLVSNIRPYFKKIWLARFAGGRSNDVLAFQPLDGETSEFLFNLLYQDQFFEFMNRTAKGAKMPRGDKDAIAGWKCVCADSELLRHFSEKVRPSYGFIDSLGRESKFLSATRDALLPKLLSGELQVHNSDAEVEA